MCDYFAMCDNHPDGVVSHPIAPWPPPDGPRWTVVQTTRYDVHTGAPYPWHVRLERPEGEW